jgi:hypothetical protein
LWTELAAAREFARDEGYWFPFTDSGRKDVVAIQAPYFRRVASDSVLIAALRARSIDRVIEFREGGGTYELTVEDLDPKNTGEEGYWSAPPWDWVLYASHESLIKPSVVNGLLRSSNPPGRNASGSSGRRPTFGGARVRSNER